MKYKYKNRKIEPTNVYKRKNTSQQGRAPPQCQVCPSKAPKPSPASLLFLRSQFLFLPAFYFFAWSRFLGKSTVKRSRQLRVIGSRGAACHATPGRSWPRVKHTANERPARRTRRIKGFFHNGPSSLLTTGFHDSPLWLI